MRLAVNNCLVCRVCLLLFFYGAATAHLHTFLGACLHNDVKVKCVPSCPKICMNNFFIRRCRPQKCTPGCACEEGWVRKDSETGECIKRSSCKRWVL